MNRDDAERVKIAAARDTWKPARADQKRECPACGLSFRALVRYPTVAHFDYARRRWCPGGAEPTPAQRGARKAKGQSLRAWRGGLPQ